jgi:alkanesulfonate monooxygenase SsuD/methylene tetrahydromethanopterin reductase-like flavin-dependent oxidoreductase (luciferase family)
MLLALTDHLEGPADQPRAEICDELTSLVHQADDLGLDYAFFTEHHAHVHHGHLPAPLLLALHLAGQTRRIRLGTAVICANLHHPLDVAEQVAVADLLTGGRLAPGFGSGSTPEELTFFGLPQSDEVQRHAQFEESLQTILAAWSGESAPARETHAILPRPRPDLPERCWLAVNSLGAARIAGRFNFNVLFSHLRTPDQYNQYRAAYHAAGGRRLIAANRPVYVADTDARAFDEAEPALRTLWRRFQEEGKIPADMKEPANPRDLCAHPINFIVGSPQTVANELLRLHHHTPYDVANLELRWAHLTPHQVESSLQRLLQHVRPLLAS